MPRASRASRQASRASATSRLSSRYRPASAEGRLRRAVTSSPAAAARITAAARAPNTRPVASRVRANARSGSSIRRTYPTSRKNTAAVPARTGARTATTATAPAPAVSTASSTVAAGPVTLGPGAVEPEPGSEAAGTGAAGCRSPSRNLMQCWYSVAAAVVMRAVASSASVRSCPGSSRCPRPDSSVRCGASRSASSRIRSYSCRASLNSCYGTLFMCIPRCSVGLGARHVDEPSGRTEGSLLRIGRW